MLETLSNYVGVIQWILTAFCGWIWWSLKGRFTTKEDYNQLEKRVTAIESAVKNLPTIKDHNDVIIRQTESNGHIKRIDEGNDRMQKQLDRIEAYLMGNRK